MLFKDNRTINIKRDNNRCFCFLGLVAAAGEGRTADVVSLLEDGADVNATDNWGNTALIHAVRGGHTETVEVLIQHPGVDLSASNNEGNNALQVAVVSGHDDISVLIQAFLMSTEVPEKTAVQPTLFGKSFANGIRKRHETNSGPVYAQYSLKLQARNVHGLFPVEFLSGKTHEDLENEARVGEYCLLFGS